MLADVGARACQEVEGRQAGIIRQDRQGQGARLRLQRDVGAGVEELRPLIGDQLVGGEGRERRGVIGFTGARPAQRLIGIGEGDHIARRLDRQVIVEIGHPEIVDHVPVIVHEGDDRGGRIDREVEAEAVLRLRG